MQAPSKPFLMVQLRGLGVYIVPWTFKMAMAKDFYEM